MTDVHQSSLWTSHEARAATQGQLVCNGPDEDVEWSVSGLSIDTRSIQPGEMFVAIKDVRDGHDFLSQAQQAGASSALVSQLRYDADLTLPMLKVDDTLRGLEAMARAARDRNFGKLIAVTGSAGKTSTKEMLRAALGSCGQVHAAAKSFNNHIGVPITLASLPARADFGVFEIGMNHAGEITPLVAMVRPHVAIITTIAEAHLEFFESLDGIAAAKAEILTGVRQGGVAVLPADSPYYEYLCTEAARNGVKRIVPFGEADAAAPGVQLIRYSTSERGDASARVTMRISGQEVSFRLNAPGKHQAVNAAAVIAAALSAGATLDRIIAGLEGFSAGDGRGATHVMSVRGKTVQIIDESYNANPASMNAALQVLGAVGRSSSARRIAVLGEMKELGSNSVELHGALAEPVMAAGVHRVFTAGADMTALRNQLPEEVRAAHADKAEDLLDALIDEVREGDIILFKGSNASRVGPLLNAFLAKAGEEA